LAGELDAKRLALLKELVPTAPRFAVLHDPANATAKPAQLADAARQLGIELKTVDIRNPSDFAPAFASFQSSSSNGLLMASSPLVFAYRAKLCELSLKAKLPAITQFREMAEAGCVMSYGIRISDGFTIAAGLADKILRGAKPRDTPAEQPTKFEFVINLKAAKALGLTVPQSLLARADEVIE
jgi:putative ABC transport system substrate-binding protein